MNSKLSPVATEELISRSVDVMTVLDESGVVRYQSPSLRRTVGYDPEEFVGENVFEYVHPDDREDALDAFRELVESEAGYTTERVELRFRHADGGWVWVESQGANEMGSEIGGYVITTREITERKEYERELERERDRLERFAGIVSHDLRNPLRVAEGRLTLAREERGADENEDEDDDEDDHLAAVARAHDRMDALIEDVLTLAREGGGDPELDAVDLREAAEACWRTVETDGATVDVASDGEVLADPSQLRHLLENLVRNAVEHGGDDVTVTIGTLDGGFYVADDGPGVPAEERDDVFEAGYSTAEGGTGFGLSIVERVADAHGWAVDVTEGADGGARFEITGVAFAE